MTSIPLANGFDDEALTPSGREALMARKCHTVVMPLGDVDYSWMNEYRCDMARFVEAAIGLSLRLDVTTDALLTAVIQSCEPPSFSRVRLLERLYADSIPIRCAHALCHHLQQMWRQPPFDNPHFLIYEAHFLRFIGDAVVIEVSYRDLPARL